MSEYIVLFSTSASFEIIPKEANCNKSPVVHVEHNLGLESWCAQHVYDHAHRTLISHRRQTTAQQLRTLQQQQQSDSLAKYLNVALLINPDVTTFWHIRRQLVQKNRLSINKELQFSALVLSIKPKSMKHSPTAVGCTHFKVSGRRQLGIPFHSIISRCRCY